MLLEVFVVSCYLRVLYVPVSLNCILYTVSVIQSYCVPVVLIKGWSSSVHCTKHVPIHRSLKDVFFEVNSVTDVHQGPLNIALICLVHILGEMNDSGMSSLVGAGYRLRPICCVSSQFSSMHGLSGPPARSHS